MSAKNPHQALLASTKAPTRLDLYVCAVVSRSPNPVNGDLAVDIALALIEQVDQALGRVTRAEPAVADQRSI